MKLGFRRASQYPFSKDSGSRELGQVYGGKIICAFDSSLAVLVTAAALNRSPLCHTKACA